MELHKGQRVRVTFNATIIEPERDFEGDVYVAVPGTGCSTYVPLEDIEPVPNEYREGQVWGDGDGFRYLVFYIRPDGTAQARDTSTHNEYTLLHPTDDSLTLLLDTE